MPKYRVVWDVRVRGSNDWQDVALSVGVAAPSMREAAERLQQACERLVAQDAEGLVAPEEPLPDPPVPAPDNEAPVPEGDTEDEKTSSAVLRHHDAHAAGGARSGPAEMMLFYPNLGVAE